MAELYAQSRRLVLAALDYIHGHNQALASGSPPSTHGLPVFRPVAAIQYPPTHPSELMPAGDFPHSCKRSRMYRSRSS